MHVLKMCPNLSHYLCLARHYLKKEVGPSYALSRGMTNTEFLTRDKSGKFEPLFATKKIQARLVDGILTVVFLGAFVGLVFLLSK